MTYNLCDRPFAEKNLLNSGHIPEHVAIIMDGNRRWAERHNLPVEKGHQQGAETLMKIVEAAAEMGIKFLTVYAFSTENWKRSPEEIRSLLQIFETYLQKMQPEMIERGVRLQTIGEIERFPTSLQQALHKVQAATAPGKRITLILALNYGGRSELARAVKKLLGDFSKKKFHLEELDEQMLASYLDTKGIVDPELLIRTSGENRVSNFLLWQISYAEVYITKILWPDFTKEDFAQAIAEYQKRERRVGL